MKSLKIASLALVAVVTTAAFAQGGMSSGGRAPKGTLVAFAQGGMMSKKPMMGKKPMMQKGSMMSDKMMMDHMMMGLTPAEKKTAAMHMAKMTPAEKAVMMKAYKMASMHHGVDLMTKSGMMTAMMGMSKSEMSTMKMMWSKMTPAEKAVATKIFKNAGKMGMGKMGGKSMGSMSHTSSKP